VDKLQVAGLQRQGLVQGLQGQAVVLVQQGEAGLLAQAGQDILGRGRPRGAGL